MDKKRIAIITKSFYPENSPRSHRATELAKEFARQGHYVDVITPRAHPAHQDVEQAFNFRIIDMGAPSWPDVKLVGSGLLLLLRRILRRSLKMLFEYPDLELLTMVKSSVKNTKGYDLLISVAVPYPVHWGVAMTRNKKKRLAKVWVADCGDPFMGQENDTFRYPFYFKYVEKWFCKKADFLAVPTEGAKDAYYSEFKDKIKVIPQGFNFNEVPLGYNKVSDNKRPMFAYAGLFIKGRRDPSELLEYLLNTTRDFEFHIYTSCPTLVEPFIGQDQQNRIKLHAPVPRIELLLRLAAMDFVVNLENVGQRQTPSKLIDYAMIKKPILSLKTGALNTRHVDEFLDGDYKHQFTVENLDQYRIENVTRQFLELVEAAR